MSSSAPLPSSDAADRLRYLADTVHQLWPDHTIRPIARGEGRVNGANDYFVFPSRRQPRLLVPAGDRRAAATAVRGYGEQARFRARALNLAARAVVGTGLGDRLLPDRIRLFPEGGGHRRGIDTHLSDVLGEPVRVSMHLSAARANRKPVVQVLGSDGSTRAFVKVGTSSLTRSLIDHEAAALLELEGWGLRLLTSPTVLSHHSWSDLRLLVLSPLPRTATRVQGGERRRDAVNELASFRRSQEQLRASQWWLDLTKRQVALAQPSAARLRSATARIDELAGGSLLWFGPSHGDWTSWNTRVVRETVLAWDWERFRPAVPLGFDVLHFSLQERIVLEGRLPSVGARTLLVDAPRLVSRFQIPDGSEILTALLYLVDLATRYLEDRQAEAGAALGRVEEWLLPTIEDGIGQVGRRPEGAPSC